MTSSSTALPAPSSSGPAVEPSWTVDADGARALAFATSGGHLEAMFRAFSEPAAELTLPPISTDLPIEAMLALDLELGVEYSPLAFRVMRQSPPRARG